MMSTDLGFLRLIALPGLLLAVLDPGPTARADDVVDDVEVEVVEVVRPPQPQFIVAPNQFDRMVFGTNSAKVWRDRFDALSALKIDEVNRTCGLSKAQSEKLRLAARGDVKRFFDRVEEKRRKFLTVNADQQLFTKFQGDLGSLQMELQQGLFGDGSLFSKTIRTTLDEALARRYEQIGEARKAERYRARVELAVATIDNALGLTSAQRQQLLTLARNETRAPRKFSQYDYQVVLIQLSRLPEAKIKPIFSESQWTRLVERFNDARQYEMNINQNDILLPDD